MITQPFFAVTCEFQALIEEHLERFNLGGSTTNALWKVLTAIGPQGFNGRWFYTTLQEIRETCKKRCETISRKLSQLVKYGVIEKKRCKFGLQIRLLVTPDNFAEVELEGPANDADDGDNEEAAAAVKAEQSLQSTVIVDSESKNEQQHQEIQSQSQTATQATAADIELAANHRLEEQKQANKPINNERAYKAKIKRELEKNPEEVQEILERRAQQQAEATRKKIDKQAFDKAKQDKQQKLAAAEEYLAQLHKNDRNKYFALERQAHNSLARHFRETTDKSNSIYRRELQQAMLKLIQQQQQQQASQVEELQNRINQYLNTPPPGFFS